MSAREHHHSTRRNGLKTGVITVSDSRTVDNDESGSLIKNLLAKAGHTLVHYEIIPDDPGRIYSAIEENIPRLDAMLINGGTGIAPRDNTFDAVKSMLDKELEGFGELFRMLSYQEIGAAAFLSRAVAGVVRGKIVVSMPGSPAACRLAMEKLLLPELGHMADLLGL